ncbi:MAG: hypothetical protein QOI12_5251 [Alphaproteobacteria bacterium]|jgi:hypothetical protein|nr:hypothetical protein [Alphaproteobacteria bacterium]
MSLRPINGLPMLMRAAGLVALVIGMAGPVRADVQVSGQANAVLVVAQDAPVDEVLGALQQAFGFQYRAAQPLSRVITGTYSGPLQRVVARLLEGYDYTIQSSSSGIGAVVFGQAGNRSTSGMPAAMGRQTPVMAPQNGQGWAGGAMNPGPSRRGASAAPAVQPPTPMLAPGQRSLIPEDQL